MIYPWRRFWYPRGLQINLADDEFLVDPDGQYGRYYSADLVTLESVAEIPCLMLLGEPGIGKSNTLAEEFKRLKSCARAEDCCLWFDLREYSSEDRIQREVFQNPSIANCLRGTGYIYLFLDSLDEGLLNINSLAPFLASEIAKLPPTKLRPRIASRPSDWPPTLEHSLVQLWPESERRIFELAPLRKVDVLNAAQLRQMSDPDAFVKQIVQANVAPLANKPITLEFLISTYIEGGSLPDNRLALYSGGCRRLCEENNWYRKESFKGRPSLTAGQRLSVAGRFAAVTQFSNKVAIWQGLEKDLSPDDVFAESMVGGSVGDAADQVTVELNGVRETLATGLFSSRGQSRLGWRHQSYAEYLAAYHFCKVPLHRLRLLILHPDGSGKVISQLRETAAWLAALNQNVFKLLIDSDPEVLLRSEVSSSMASDRALLARNLLSAFDAGSIFQPLHELRATFARLDNPELANIVKPFLTHSTRSEDARLAAIEMIRACRVTSLLGDLSEMALDSKEPIIVRTLAAAAIVDIGDEAAKEALLPLVTIPPEEDPKDDLKGYGLRVGWPRHLTAVRLFAALSPQQHERYIGAYGRFLMDGVTPHLDASNIVRALEWAQQYTVRGDPFDRLRTLASNILETAIRFVGSPAVSEALARVVYKQAREYSDEDSFTKKLQEAGDTARRALANAMVPFAIDHEHGGYFISSICAITAADVTSLVADRRACVSVRESALFAEIIVRAMRYDDSETFEMIYSASLTDVGLQVALAPYIRPIQLDGPEAEQLRTIYSRADPRTTPVAPQTTVNQSIAESLTNGNTETFRFLDYELRRRGSGERASMDPIPGWSELDQGNKDGVVMSAQAYLSTRPSGENGHWGKDGTFSYAMEAGYSALQLFSIISPEKLDQFSDADWEFWTPIVVTHLTNGAHLTSRTILLGKAFSRAEAVFHQTVCDVLDEENRRRGMALILQNIGDIWSDQLAISIRARLTGGTLAPDAFKAVLAWLLKRNDEETKTFALHLVASVVSLDAAGRAKGVRAAAEILAHHPDEWQSLWPTVRDHPQFGIDVLKVAAYENQYTSFATAIPADAVADLCIWMAERGLEREELSSGAVTPDLALAQWWNVLVSSLTQQGTPAAVSAVRRIAAALPKYPGLKESLKRAQEQARRATWTPMSALDIVGLSSVPKSVVMSLHGIRTRGPWQKQLNSALQAEGFFHEQLDYDFFRAFKLLMPWQRSRKIDWFRAEYERVVGASEVRPSIVAHSFGTYILTRALEKYTELKFNRIILCGSIVREDYDWDSVIAAGRVKAVLNQYGDNDFWVGLGGRVVADGGFSGLTGFTTTNPNVFQRLRGQFKHSDYFYPLNYKENWLPFLSGVDPA